MVVVWSRKSCLGSAEIASSVVLVLFKDEGCRVSRRFHLFVSDVNQQVKVKISLHDPRDGKILLRYSVSR